MKYGQPVTMEYIERGGWFLFRAIQSDNCMHIVIASLMEIVDVPLLLSPKEARENQLFYLKTADIKNFKKCQNVVLPRGVLEIQVDKGIYKVVEFDGEKEEAKFYLLNS